MTLREFTSRLNDWGHNHVPFLFITDFELKSPLAFTLDEIDKSSMLYCLNGVTNSSPATTNGRPPSIKKLPINVEDYASMFNSVQYHLHYGDTFLTNLTIRTKIELSTTLKDLFNVSRANYKLWMKDQFLVFSPETFVKIREGRIYSFPMKGTIDASIPGAEDIILNNKKELAEHVTIVDLIRNDLSMVSTNVKVARFRYLEEVRTNHKNLLQVSSEIVGDLPSDYKSHLGDILLSLLPAGSVSGAPKEKTLEIIRKAEGADRKYFTGVFGFFDGHQLDSGVMIRYIEQDGPDFYYRSGGGITAQSEVTSEFNEAIDKVYVPVN